MNTPETTTNRMEIANTKNPISSRISAAGNITIPIKHRRPDNMVGRGFFSNTIPNPNSAKPSPQKTGIPIKAESDISSNDTATSLCPSAKN